MWFLATAWLETKQAYAKHKVEQEEKDRRTKQAVPAFVAASRMWVEGRKLDDALIQVNLALDYDRDNPEAHLLKGQVLIAQKKFDSAHAALDRYLELRPDDADAKELNQLCRQAKPDDGERILALADVLLRQKALMLSDCLRKDVSKLIKSSEKLLPPLRKRIDASWPGLANRLTVEKDGSLRLSLSRCGDQVRDLSPLQGMPLASLNLGACRQVRDLKPLQGMKLTSLDLGECESVTDLTPLQGMKLTFLSLFHCRKVRDLTPLQGMKLITLNLHHCDELEDLTPLQGMPLTSLDLEYCGRVRAT